MFTCPTVSRQQKQGRATGNSSCPLVQNIDWVGSCSPQNNITDNSTGKEQRKLSADKILGKVKRHFLHLSNKMNSIIYLINIKGANKFNIKGYIHFKRLLYLACNLAASMAVLIC